MNTELAVPLSVQPMSRETIPEGRRERGRKGKGGGERREVGVGVVEAASSLSDTFL